MYFLRNQLPALECTSSKIVANNLNALHMDKGLKFGKTVESFVSSNPSIYKNWIHKWWSSSFQKWWTRIGWDQAPLSEVKISRFLWNMKNTYVRVHPCHIQCYYNNSSEIVWQYEKYGKQFCWLTCRECWRLVQGK